MFPYLSVMLRIALACAAAALALAAGTAGAAAAPAVPLNPCAGGAPLPQCVDAIGPIVDVSASWGQYQPATVQVVPISDYATDPEDAPPPLGAGVCGGETSAAPGLPTGEVMAAPPPGVPAPPGTHGPYCVLHYLASDFSRLAGGSHRLLIDYAAIPAGNPPLAPGADGHWAAKLWQSVSVPAASPPNGHSPNIKNLCSDKFLNPSPGSACALLAPGDEQGIEVEGDSSTYHHFPKEGRYYNGPAYLAGDGARVAYHYVRGAYVDVSTSAPAVWYSVDYRGQGDALPDTDQSYGCACEMPPFGHQAFSPDYRLRARRR